MTNHENEAVKAAEKILEGAYAEARAEECPQGKECSVHFRVDDQIIDEPAKYVRLINYVGDYAVVTEDNHQLDSPILMVKIVLGVAVKEDLPPRWETIIYHVGDGVIGDLSDKSLEDRRNAVRYAAQHDVWDELIEVHDGTVSFLEAGLIDVSKPFDLEA